MPVLHVKSTRLTGYWGHGRNWPGSRGEAVRVEVSPAEAERMIADPHLVAVRVDGATEDAGGSQAAVVAAALEEQRGRFNAAYSELQERCLAGEAENRSLRMQLAQRDAKPAPAPVEAPHEADPFVPTPEAAVEASVPPPAPRGDRDSSRGRGR